MNLKRSKAVTLTELIAGTIIFGIIIVGITAVDFAMRQSHQSSSQNSILAMQTSAMMLHITKNAGAITGDRNDLGIIVDAAAAGAEQIWLRIDENTPPTPGDYTDDQWLSYEHSGNDLLFCRGVTSPDPCPFPDPDTETLGTIAGFTPALAADDAMGVQNFYVEIILVNRPNPALPPNDFENPEYTLTSRITPASSSF